jgi:hypothetical protein
MTKIMLNYGPNGRRRLKRLLQRILEETKQIKVYLLTDGGGDDDDDEYISDSSYNQQQLISHTK